MNQPNQFTYSEGIYKVVVTKIDLGEFHWQVLSLNRVMDQGESCGYDAQVNALAAALDSLRQLKEQKS